LGLQVRIFLRDLSLRLGEVGEVEERVWVRERGEAAHGAIRPAARELIVEELVEVEVCRREGRVTNQIIVCNKAGLGGREHPVFKEIAICVTGPRIVEMTQEIKARHCRSERIAGFWLWVASHDRGISVD